MIEDKLYPEAEWDFRPINDHIIVRMDKVELTTPSGIILLVDDDLDIKTEAKESAHKVTTGTVLAAGFSKVHSLTGNRSELIIRKGDRIRLRDVRYPSIEYRGEACVQLVETDIIGIYFEKGSTDNRLSEYWKEKSV